MPPHQNSKYRTPKTHFQKQPPLSPAPAYSAPLQWTPPSSPAIPNLPPYSTPELECPASRSFPLEEPLAQPTPLPLFRANHPSTPPPFPSFGNPCPMQHPAPRQWNLSCNQQPRRRPYLRLETLLLVACLVSQLAALMILGTILTQHDLRLCGGGLRLLQPSTGHKGDVTQASLDRSQSITPEQ